MAASRPQLALPAPEPKSPIDVAVCNLMEIFSGALMEWRSTHGAGA